MLIYFDGFDAHIPRVFSGFDVGAGSMQDSGRYWTGGTTQFYQYPTGFQEGRSFFLGSLHYAMSSLRGENATRVGFWARGNSASAISYLVGFGISSSTTDSRWVQVRADNSLWLTDGDGNPYAGPAALESWGGTEWKHYEAYINTSGLFQLRVNGVLVLSADTPGTQYINVLLGKPVLNSSISARYDHLYVTDGPPLEGNDIYGVQVVAGVDNYLGKHSNLQGSLIIEGTRYVSTPAQARISTDFPYADGKNLSNIVNYLFHRDPSTGLPWTKAGLELVDQWGLCFFHNSILPKGEMRVTQAHFAVLEKFDDRGPIVKFHEAGGVTYFSGPWRKTNPQLTFSEHIRPIPRRNTTEVADTMALFIDDDGCMLFNIPDEDGGSGVRPTEYVGITFAEEFREDYRDWVRIDGTGQSFESYFISGYSVLGEGNRKFQDNYVTVNYENVPTGRAYIQGLWDYAESPDTGRWSMRQVIDNKGGDYTHAHRRIKIRGNGKSLSIKITNNGDFPFIINGWTVFATSNQGV